MVITDESEVNLVGKQQEHAHWGESPGCFSVGNQETGFNVLLWLFILF